MNSEAYRIFTENPPKVVIWSYRMDGIYSLVGKHMESSYVRVAPNIRLAGRELALGKATAFHAPVPGAYALYGRTGERIAGVTEVDGRVSSGPFELPKGKRVIRLRSGPPTALLLPVGSYAGVIRPGRDNDQLFANVYD